MTRSTERAMVLIAVHVVVGVAAVGIVGSLALPPRDVEFDWLREGSMGEGRRLR